MRLQVGRARGVTAHLGYCTNIHPGETWSEIFDNLQRYVPAVKASVSPNAAFGIGLRLSSEAANALVAPGALERFETWLTATDAYVFTLNGFPYGRFHGTRVKEGVYLPDWSSVERLEYTNTLARILAALIADESEPLGSISTVPGCFRPLGTEPVQACIAERLLLHAKTLWQLREDRGVEIVLGLEPEPACLLETTEEAARFIEGRLLSKAALGRFRKLTRLGSAEAESALRRHLGVCVDACHAAVEFEDPETSLNLLDRAGVRVAKLQVTTGLLLRSPGEIERLALSRFADEVYLHQTVVRSGAALTRYSDLPEALSRKVAVDEEWRVHFHVPVFQRQLGPFESTQSDLEALLAAYCRQPCTLHLEVETYTFDVLPPELRLDGPVEAIGRELAWAMARLDS